MIDGRTGKKGRQCHAKVKKTRKRVMIKIEIGKKEDQSIKVGRLTPDAKRNTHLSLVRQLLRSLSHLPQLLSERYSNGGFTCFED